MFTPLDPTEFERVLASTSIELSSAALGGRVLSCSDEWFADARNLIKPGPAQSLKGQFGPKGALYDGWESRRHNRTYDWAIVRLGPKGGGSVRGLDIDTTTFNGNEAPAAAVYAACLEAGEEQIGADDPRWEELLPTVRCGPLQHHMYASAEPSARYTHVKLHMIPDGGISRFRVYGNVSAPPIGQAVGERVVPERPELNALDLAYVLNGGRVVYTSDQHFGVGPNLLLPGRGKDMGDGWETKRSRTPGHRDWVVIRLAEPAVLHEAELDTIHFLGNFPQSVSLHGCYSPDNVPAEHEVLDSARWIPLLDRGTVGPGERFFFPLDATRVLTHVRLTIFPDGGIKRVRLTGRRAAPLEARYSALNRDVLAALPPVAADTQAASVPHVQSAAPLSGSGFARYGQVIAAPDAGGSGVPTVKTVNQGTARKLCEMAHIDVRYPTGTPAQTNVHLYVSEPSVQRSGALPFPVRVLERHRYTQQMFVPVTPPGGAHATGREGYLVIVALNGADDRPDPATIAAFWAESNQGIVYHPGVWHAPLVAAGSAPTQFVCVVGESGTPADLDEVYYDAALEAQYKQ